MTTNPTDIYIHITFHTHAHRHNDDPSSYLAFIDASLAALLAPVLCCLYALERDLRVYRVLRRGFRWVGRWCLGRGGWGAKRRGGEMVA